MDRRPMDMHFAHQLLHARDWQARKEFEEVCNWWQRDDGVEGSSGVCVLVGIGGVGKTAIVDRFLLSLPSVVNNSSAEIAQLQLRQPSSVFVYSFYDDEKSDSFFRHLQMWIEGSPYLNPILSFEQLLYAVRKKSGLIVVDGLEKVQESRGGGAYGRIQCSRFRELLNHVGNGTAKGLRVLVTSRFPLTDLIDLGATSLKTIDVDRLDVMSCVTLLRERGVQGNDDQLRSLSESCGRHALSVDLLGGYLAEFKNGAHNAAVELELYEDAIGSKIDQEDNDQKRAVLLQNARLSRIVKQYCDSIKSADEASLALLQRICLFRLAVDRDTLLKLFTGAAAVKVSGGSLSRIDATQLQAKLDWLVCLGIIERVDPQDDSVRESTSNQRHKPIVRYTIHPALRDGFLASIGEDERKTSHNSIREFFEAQSQTTRTTLLATEDGTLLMTEDGALIALDQAPGTQYPTDLETLDRLEEIIHHSIQCGEENYAWDFYWDRMGNFQHLGLKLGDYERGARICSDFFDHLSPNAIIEKLRSEFLSHPNHDDDGRINNVNHSLGSRINEWAAYLVRLGRIDEAILLTKLAIEFAEGSQRSMNAMVSKVNLSEYLCKRARLAESANVAQSIPSTPLSPELQANSSLWEAATFAHRGMVEASLAKFTDSLMWQHELESHAPTRPLWSTRGIKYAELLARIGRLDEAENSNNANIAICRSMSEIPDDDPDVHECHLVEATIALARSDFVKAAELVAKTNEWAASRKAREILCCSYLIDARIKIASIDAKRPDSSLLSIAEDLIDRGLKLARLSGYGLHFIDLLLVRARKHLLRNDSAAALEDISTALDTGVAENEEAGQPELLAATNEGCGYSWGIALGLQLRGEAKLLQAAQMIGSNHWRPCLECDSILEGPYRDRCTCHSCRSAHGKLADLNVAINASADTPDRIPEWKRIRHHLRQRFGDQLSDLQLWERLTDILEAEHSLAPNDYLRLSLIDVEEFLKNGSQKSFAAVRNSDKRLAERALVFDGAANLIDQAKEHLEAAMDQWHALRDPIENGKSNFSFDGNEYNFHASETQQIINLQDSGLLTINPIEPAKSDALQDSGQTVPSKATSDASNSKPLSVFISYPWKANQSIDDFGWIDRWYLEFKSIAEPMIPGILIFFDKTRIRGNDDLDEKLEQAIKQSDVFVAIHSPVYATRPICVKELELFVEKSGGKTQANGRLFLVNQYWVEKAERLEHLRNLRGYEFFYLPDPIKQVRVPLGADDSKTKAKYDEVMHELVEDIRKQFLTAPMTLVEDKHEKPDPTEFKELKPARTGHVADLENVAQYGKKKQKKGWGITKTIACFAVAVLSLVALVILAYTNDWIRTKPPVSLCFEIAVAGVSDKFLDHDDIVRVYECSIHVKGALPNESCITIKTSPGSIIRTRTSESHFQHKSFEYDEKTKSVSNAVDRSDASSMLSPVENTTLNLTIGLDDPADDAKYKIRLFLDGQQLMPCVKK